MPKTPSPFDAVRDAFAELDASEKTAFVLEATFAAVGEGLAETGRRFSDAVKDIDEMFATPGAPGAPRTATKKKPAPKKPAAKKKPAPKSGGKTAGRATKPGDTAPDDDA